MKDSHKFQLKCLLFSLWAIFVFWHFAQNFPITNLVEIMLNGLMLIILLFFFTALGRRIFRCFHMRFTSFAEEWCFSFGIGSGIIMLLVFGLAVLGLLYEVLIVSLILVLFLFVYKDARHLCIQGYNAFLHVFFRENPIEDIALLLLAGFAGITSFLAAATPPFFFDALLYHLAVPHKYLLLHGFHYIPHQPLSNVPFNLGMLFVVAMSFSKGMLVQLLSWSYTPMTALAVYAFAKSRWGGRLAITSATIMLLVPGPLILSTVTAADCGVTFYSFLAVSALISWCTSHKNSWFFCSTVFCSIAVGSKYQAIVVTLFAVEIMLFVHEYGIEKHSFLDGLRRIVLFNAIVLCGISPWLIKNFIYTGNPIYPFFNAFFGVHASPILDYSQFIQRDGNPIQMTLLDSHISRGRQWLEVIILFLKAPWRVTMTVSGAAGKTGVLFLVSLPCIFLLKKVDRALKYLLIYSACSLCFWLFLLTWIHRFIFPIFPPLSLVAAYIVWQIPISHCRRRFIIGGITVLLLYHFFLFLSEEIRILRPFGYLFANQSKEEFLLEHGVNYYPAIQYINHKTPNDSKILFVGESRGYYCERDYLLYTPMEAIDDNELPLRKLIVDSENIEELMRKLQRIGITHILVNTAEMKRFMEAYLPRNSYFGFQTEKDQEILSSLFSPQYSRPLISQYQVRVYEIFYPAETL